jgi:hypothetical protein
MSLPSMKLILIKIFLVVLTLAMCVTFACLFIGLYPWHQDHRRRGIVLDGLWKPIPGAVLRFRDAKGNVIAVFNADDNGEFRSNRLDELRDHPRIDGYVLFYSIGNTGGAGTIYYFSPPSEQAIFAHDASGRPVANADIDFQENVTNYEGPEIITGKNGYAYMTAPLAARYDVNCVNPGFEVGSVRKTAAAYSVSYDIMLVPPGTIKGRLMGLTPASLDGSTILAERYVGGQFVDFGTQSTTDAHGNFILAHLKPGDYRVSWLGSQYAGAPGKDFPQQTSVASGETVDVTLRYR